MKEYIVEYFMPKGSIPLASRTFAHSEAQARTNVKNEKGQDIIIRSTHRA